METCTTLKGAKVRVLNLKKTTTCKELLRIVCHILKVDLMKHNLSMKYILNVSIPTTPIQLRDEEDMKFSFV